MKPSNPFFPAFLMGLVLLALTLTFPKIPKAPGVKSPIVELEFARNSNTAQQITANFDASYVDAFERNLAHDRLFILVYAGFIFFVALGAMRIWGTRWILLAGLAALVAGRFDYLENGVLKKILSKAPDMEAAFADLHTYTWIKWALLSLAFLLFVPLQRRSGRIGQGISVFAILTATAGISAWFNPGMTVIFTQFVMLEFGLLFAWAMLNGKTK